jgi:tyrosyl-DNA phosphodiesterase 2
MRLNLSMASPHPFSRAYQSNRGLFTPHHKPQIQPFYGYNSGVWSEVTARQPTKDSRVLSSVMRLLTWNLDAFHSGCEIRVHAALNLLKQEFDNTPKSLPIVFMLQEISLSGLRQIKASRWIQDNFHMADISDKYWADKRYGTTTLIDKRLSIEKVFRLYYDSKFGRDVIFVDVAVDAALGSSLTSKTSSIPKTLRIGNTHLESLVSNPPLRPAQFATSTRHLKAPWICAGILAGDFNAIQDFDRTLHNENKLNDAFLALGGLEDSVEGHTWGYQCAKVLMQRFGPSRMDKVLFCGEIRVDELRRIGVGAKVDESRRNELSSLTGGLEWITDHYGLSAMLTILPDEGDTSKI